MTTQRDDDVLLSPAYTSNSYVTIFVWQFLYAGISSVYMNNFYVTSLIYLPVYAPSARAIFIWEQKIEDWDLRMT